MSFKIGSGVNCHGVDCESLPSVTASIEKFSPAHIAPPGNNTHTVAISVISSQSTSGSSTAELTSESSESESSTNEKSSTNELSTSPNSSRTEKKRHRAFTFNSLTALPVSRATSSHLLDTQEQSAFVPKAESSEQLNSLFSSTQEQSIFQEITTTEVRFTTDVTQLKNVIRELGSLLSKEDPDKISITHVLNKLGKHKESCLLHYHTLFLVLEKIQTFSNDFSTTLFKAAGGQNFTSLPVGNIANYIRTVDLTIFEDAGRLVHEYQELCINSGTSKKEHEPYLEQAFRLMFEKLYPNSNQSSKGVGARLYAVIFQRCPRYELLFKELLKTSLSASSGIPTDESEILKAALEKIKSANKEMTEATPKAPETPRKRTDSKRKF